MPSRPSVLPVRLALAALLAGLCASQARADEAFLSLRGLGVASGSPNHDTWMNLLAAHAEISRQPGASTPTLAELTFVKYVDKSSPKLADALCSGKRFKRVEIELASADGLTYGKLVAELAAVTGYEFNLSSGDDRPTESISLNFSNVRLTTSPRGRTGVCSSFFDLQTGSFNFAGTQTDKAPPVIDPLDAVVLRSGEQLDVPVHVSDPDTPIQQVTVTPALGDGSVLPAAAVSIFGDGSVRTLRIAAPAAVTGVSLLRLTAADGAGGVGETAFRVLILPQGSMISLTNNVVPEHSPAGTFVGMLGMINVPPAGVQWRLLDSAGGRFRLEGDHLVVNDPFRLDFEMAPDHRVVVEAFDPGSGSPISAAAFSIRLTDIPEGAYDLWRAQNFSSRELLDGRIAGSNADADLDGFSNVMEYALGMPPRSGKNPFVPAPGVVLLNGIPFPTLTYIRRAPDADAGLSVEPEASFDGVQWLSGDEYFAEVSRREIGDGLHEVVVRFLAPVGGGKFLLRLSVVR